MKSNWFIPHRIAVHPVHYSHANAGKWTKTGPSFLASKMFQSYEFHVKITKLSYVTRMIYLLIQLINLIDPKEINVTHNSHVTGLWIINSNIELVTACQGEFISSLAVQFNPGLLSHSISTPPCHM